MTPMAAPTSTGPGGGVLPAVQSALGQGNAALARAHCDEWLQRHPRDAAAHRHLAQLHAAAGDQLKALRAAMRACELAPHDARCWSDLGRVHARFGEYAHAARCFLEAVDADPAHADGWHNLGLAWRQLGKAAQAFDAFKRCLLLDGERAESWLSLGSLLVETGQFEDSVACLERAASADPSLARARSRLAEHWSQRGKARRAEALFRQALALDAQHVQGWFGLGRTLEDLGDAAGALGCYRHALAIEPHHPPALAHCLALSQGEAEPSLLRQADALVQGTAARDEARAAVGYGLAKYHDRQGNHEAASWAGQLANAARRRQAGPLDRAALKRRADELVATCTQAFFAERRRFGLGSEQPVFIVGLPRSGTTLVEQVLSAHPRVHGAGELPDLARLAERCLGADDELWQAACRLDEARSRLVAADYLAALREGAPRGCLRLCDKSPLNFFQLAFAALLFPQARVIHCVREPRDTALSIWMENFNAQQRYATDFGDLAFMNSTHQRLMAHWHEHLPLPILTVRYEDTVADLPRQARQWTDFLGLPWDARCLDFHAQARAVQTPSRWQVRQPVYNWSVGRWKAYAAFLPELDLAFRAAESQPCQ